VRYLAAVLAIAAMAGCSRPAPPVLRSGALRGVPIVLVSIDTLRADRLPLYGYKAGSTPVLDRLGRDGIVFDDVYSHSPLTLPAHTSLLTGLLPFRHGVRDNIGYALAPAHRTLAGRLKAAGYRTGAAVSAFVLRHQTGIARDFDFFDDRIEIAGAGESLADSQRDGGAAVDSLAAWIAQQGDAPVFAFLHLYEPHTPYAPPPQFRGAHPYDGEISYADSLVGRFIDKIAASGLADRAIVAVVSDHGEGLNDHGEAEHGIFLYRESLHVPWILKLPKDTSPRGTRVAGTLGHVDIAATLLDLVGVDASGIDGASVVDAVANTRAVDRTVYSETMYPRLHFGWSDLASATEGRYRFIRAPRPELFDHTSDPREQRNIAAERTSTTTALGGWIERTVAGAPLADPTPVSADVRERLKALGYVTSSVPSGKPGAALADPKDMIGSFEGLKRAQGLASAGRHADAVRELEQITRAQPAMLDAWETLAKSLVSLGRTKDAIGAFGHVLALDPLKPETLLALARIYALERDAAKAREHARLATERDPATGYETLAGLALDEGRLDDAAGFARRSIDADASRYMNHFYLGTVAHRQGRFPEAITEFRRAIDGMAVEPHAVVRNLHAALGDCLARTGQVAEAEREFQKEISLIPTSSEARIGLASLYRSQGRDADARAAITGLVGATPQADANAYFTVVRTLSVLGDEPAAREWATKARALFPRDVRFR
jgi:tetratricopeptide (TPR) repeat protein